MTGYYVAAGSDSFLPERARDLAWAWQAMDMSVTVLPRRAATLEKVQEKEGSPGLYRLCLRLLSGATHPGAWHQLDKTEELRGDLRLQCFPEHAEFVIATQAGAPLEPAQSLWPWLEAPSCLMSTN